MKTRIPGWTRVVLALIALADLETGAWALVSPRSWYERFPGFGRHWIVAVGPAFNEHLVRDAAAGFFAVGLGAAIAAVWPRRDFVILASALVVVHSLPHFLYHVTNPVPALSTTDVITGVWGLALESAAGLAVLATALRTRASDASESVDASLAGTAQRENGRRRAAARMR